MCSNKFNKPRHSGSNLSVPDIHYPYPTANLPAQSIALINKAPNALPSSATLLSPAESILSNPAAHKTALPIAHRLRAPAVANIAATPYPQPRRILSASTLFATTAHPNDLAAAGTSYSHITINIGNSFVDDDTSSAVDTEFGLEYCGRIPSSASGE
jgi:hypothetical protein